MKKAQIKNNEVINKSHVEDKSYINKIYVSLCLNKRLNVFMPRAFG